MMDEYPPGGGPPEETKDVVMTSAANAEDERPIGGNKGPSTMEEHLSLGGPQPEESKDVVMTDERPIGGGSGPTGIPKVGNDEEPVGKSSTAA